MTLQESVEAVAMIAEEMSLDRSSFHLSSCGGCRAPTFQQPCPLCSYYPRGSDKGHWFPDVVDRAGFVAAVLESGVGGQGGNLATWYVASTGRITFYDRMRPRFLAKAQTVEGLVDPGEIFDEVSTAGRSVFREHLGHGDRQLWNALFELSHMDDEMSRLARRRHDTSGSYLSANDDLLADVRSAVAAIHSGDTHAKSEANQALIDKAYALIEAGVAEEMGRARTALGCLRKASEEFAPTPSP